MMSAQRRCDFHGLSVGLALGGAFLLILAALLAYVYSVGCCTSSRVIPILAVGAGIAFALLIPALVLFILHLRRTCKTTVVQEPVLVEETKVAA